MQRSFTYMGVVMAVWLSGFATVTAAQHGPPSPRLDLPTHGGTLRVPEASQEHPSHVGRHAHTNTKVVIPMDWDPAIGVPGAGYLYETPASLACVYHLVPPVAGCNPQTVTATPTGGSRVMAIVDAFHNPHAASDLAYFSAQFGLPFAASQFTVVYATGVPPPLDPTGGWALEAALDIEYAHAMAPHAHIYLVEAASAAYADLLNAVDVASNVVRCGQPSCPHGGTGTGEVSLSWGGSEFAGETALDSHFLGPGVVYVAAAGDTPGTSWPGTSPHVVSAGGTTIARNPTTGALLYEITWDAAGGGVSAFEPRPSYQNALASLVGAQRGVPDLAFNANPVAGVWVYNSNAFEGQPGGWFIVGGTSLAAPALAGIINAAGQFAASSAAELTTIYANRTNAAVFKDIIYGPCGPSAGYLAVPGWDFCTGVGSVLGFQGK